MAALNKEITQKSLCSPQTALTVWNCRQVVKATSRRWEVFESYTETGADAAIDRGRLWIIRPVWNVLTPRLSLTRDWRVSTCNICRLPDTRFYSNTEDGGEEVWHKHSNMLKSCWNSTAGFKQTIKTEQWGCLFRALLKLHSKDGRTHWRKTKPSEKDQQHFLKPFVIDEHKDFNSFHSSNMIQTLCPELWEHRLSSWGQHSPTYESAPPVCGCVPIQRRTITSQRRDDGCPPNAPSVSPNLKFCFFLQPFI